MCSISKRMYKDMRKCNKVETGYIGSLQRVLADIRASSSARQDPVRTVVEVFEVVMDSLQVYSKNLRANQDIIFVEPITKLNDVYKKVELYTKQREQKLQEYERQQNRLDKLERKTGGGSQSHLTVCQSSRVEMSQITAMVSRTRMDYERVHDRIMLEVPQLLEVRASYLEVCLMAAIRAQVIYYTDCTVSLCGAMGSLQDEDIAAADYMTEDDILKTTTEHLAAITMLSIVGTPTRSL